MEMTAMVFFFPGCVSVRDAEATGCCTNPVISSIPKWHRPRLDRAVEQCIGRIRISTGSIGKVWDQAQSQDDPSEQGGRVDVDTVDPDGEVERAVGDGNHIAASNRGTPANQESPHEPVGGPESARMVEADEQRACDRTRERDHAVGGCTHEAAGTGVVFDAAVACAVRAVGKTERVEHRSVGRWRQADARGPGGHG
ncbi:MAG: hypothetical protein R2707_00575 [Acidimicrobiales bacterium]